MANEAPPLSPTRKTQDGTDGDDGGCREAKNIKRPRPAVLLMHGLMQDSEALLCGGRWGLFPGRTSLVEFVSCAVLD